MLCLVAHADNLKAIPKFDNDFIDLLIIEIQ